ncbi:uncharacterized protein LOC129803693 isoform X1 [Phlebotomus papatasi]|uniref:uncharacterized protein LOC129803693 isoform X1 n=1 Tax=Phlebotomus papatasi TaxID=29031 RepID=UPI00248442C8|nr:uncharacterized protein LOC129803693 isoform X1 [Phlebotomus papatasi]
MGRKRRSRVWTYEKERNLLSYYKILPELWNPHIPEFRDNRKKSLILKKIALNLSGDYPESSSIFNQEKVHRRFLALKKKYNDLVAKGGDEASEWEHYKDFVFFDGIIARTAQTQAKNTTATAEIPARTEEFLSIRNVASAVDLQESDPDTKVFIDISSDEEDPVPPAAESPKPSQPSPQLPRPEPSQPDSPSPQPVPAKRRRTARSIYIESTINSLNSSNTPPLPESSGQPNHSFSGIADDARKLENQKFCDFLASRMNDMPKESSRDFQFKILMLLNQNY